jgi:hypothetical protein
MASAAQEIVEMEAESASFAKVADASATLDDFADRSYQAVRFVSVLFGLSGSTQIAYSRRDMVDAPMTVVETAVPEGREADDVRLGAGRIGGVPGCEPGDR